MIFKNFLKKVLKYIEFKSAIDHPKWKCPLVVLSLLL